MNRWHAEVISRIAESFQKNVSLKDWRSWVSLVYVITFAATKNPFRDQLRHVMITYPFSFQSYPSSMSESTFSLPYTSWLPACLLFWVAHIFLIFSSSFSLWIKPFNFLSMTTFLCYPYHENCLTMRSFIYSPTTHYVQLVLTDVGFLKAHLSTSLSPSTSTHYLG